MFNKNYVYKHTFNTLTALLSDADVINPYCETKADCEQTINIIKSLLAKMEQQIEKMED